MNILNKSFYTPVRAKRQKAGTNVRIIYETYIYSECESKTTDIHYEKENKVV